MRSLLRLQISRDYPIRLLAVFGLVAVALAQGGETITATAHVKTAGGAEASAPVRVVVSRFSSDADRDELLAALKKEGSTRVRDLLMARNPVGSVQVGATNTAIKYAYARATGDGRLITLVTATPIAFVGAGLPGAKPKTGYDLGLLLVQVMTTGAGHGELVPAAKLKIGDQGGIVTDGYSEETVRLSNVLRK